MVVMFCSENLLECRNACCGDEAYTSFADLRLDLQLMVDSPSYFLNNIHWSAMQKLPISDKLYGREEELLKLDKLYKRHMAGEKISGVAIAGGAGVGKSKLAAYMQTLTSRANGYFLSAKFEQNQMSLKPLSTISNLFDSLCDTLFNDSSHSQLTKIEKKIINAVGKSIKPPWVSAQPQEAHAVNFFT